MNNYVPSNELVEWACKRGTAENLERMTKVLIHLLGMVIEGENSEFDNQQLQNALRYYRETLEFIE